MAAINADQVFLARILRLADERVTHDETTYVYRFDWAASPFGACHCIDLPFTFGNLGAWGPDAAMLGDVPRADLEPLSAAFGAAIGSFVRTGRPSLGDDVDGWPAYESGERVVAVFGSDAPALVPGLGQEQRELFDECRL
jgi:para-nitrobenzyl esterase